MTTNRLATLGMLALVAMVFSSVTPVEAAPSPGSGGGSFPTLDSCVAATYGSDGVLSFRNRCSQDAHVLFFANSNVYGGWHIASGSEESTGYSGVQISAAGGMTYYACPEGSSPVDSNNQSVAKRRAASYRCI